ncbi:kinesin-like protein KIFC1 isoform X2 [Microcaecilia unicolor]|uniref:Kinesin-like protein KIFC1 isoform X2 n=1 Tax=Microcaecilia unicolor TaxID=1415580 RepID=A0A6P7XKN1_9AMPH|nr:kinesin-like protein KIFC1 isoform X2 [Microcaecilia unicolor]
MENKPPFAVKATSRLPVPSSLRNKRVLSEENLPAIDMKRFCESSAEEEMIHRRIPASIATTRPKALAVAAVTRSQVTGRKSVSSTRSGFRAPASSARVVNKKAIPSISAPRTGSSAVVATVPGKKRAAWDLKGQVSDMRDKVTSYKDKVHLLSGDNVQLRRNMEEMQQRLDTLRVENKELSSRFCMLETDMKTVQEKLQQSIHQVKELTSLSTGQKQQITDQLQTIQELQEAKQSLCRLLDSAELKLKQAEQENSHLRDETKARRAQIGDLQQEIQEKEEKLHMQEMDRRHLHNVIQELKGNIRVFCRVRPLLKSEDQKNLDQIHFPLQDKKSLVLSRTEESHIGREKEDVKYDFSFDHVFPPLSSQAEVFEEISLLVQSALDGYHVCIFAYGQTGSGKTYTMEGPDDMADETMGMIPRAVDQIFQHAAELKSRGWTYKFTANFLEIYNETLQDLLVKRSEKNVDYEIKRVSATNEELHVTNLQYVAVASKEEVYKLLHSAKMNRSVAKTSLNDRSSRSHSIFQLRIEGRNEMRDLKTNAVLSLVDLAGSERLDKSLSKGDRLKETQAINSSLSNLGLVITSLSNKDTHIPYRNSKLTYLLQNSLRGNSKMLMFVNISPLGENFSESLNSLRFASKVNECVVGTAQVNRK